MGASLLVSSRSIGLNDNGTRYLAFVSCAGTATTEANVEMPVRQAGTFGNLYIYASTNTQGVTSVFTVRKSVADTAITVSYTAGQTGVKEDTSNTEAFASTDEIALKVVLPSDPGTTTITVEVVGIQFTPDTSTNTVSSIGGTESVVVSSESATRFIAVSGDLDDQATESITSWRVRGSFTIRDFYVNVSANARTTDTTFGTRKNAGAGTISVTYTSGQTGVKEDTSNSDSVAAGDDVNFYVTTSTGTESLAVRAIYAHVVSTAGQFPFINQDASGESVAANVTTFAGVAGYLATFSATEANRQFLPRVTFTAKELCTNVSANTLALLTTTVTIRINGAESAVTLSYAAGETGVKNDGTNSATVTAGSDEIDYEVATPITTGTITFRTISMLGEIAAAGFDPATFPRAFYLDQYRQLPEIVGY